jgi:hypothetical protein
VWAPAASGREYGDDPLVTVALAAQAAEPHDVECGPHAEVNNPQTWGGWCSLLGRRLTDPIPPLRSASRPVISRDEDEAQQHIAQLEQRVVEQAEYIRRLEQALADAGVDIPPRLVGHAVSPATSPGRPMPRRLAAPEVLHPRPVPAHIVDAERERSATAVSAPAAAQQQPRAPHRRTDSDAAIFKRGGAVAEQALRAPLSVTEEVDDVGRDRANSTTVRPGPAREVVWPLAAGSRQFRLFKSLQRENEELRLQLLHVRGNLLRSRLLAAAPTPLPRSASPSRGLNEPDSPVGESAEPPTQL